MWTRRIRYIKDIYEFNDYLKSMQYFHDFIIGSFSYDSKSHRISLTIEEDYTNIDNTNSDALVWNLECEGVTTFQMQDMDGLSRWWISEILFEDSTLHFQLVNGYFAFELQSLSFGIPNKPRTESDNVIQKINLDYLLKEVESGISIEQISYAFDSDSEDILRTIEYGTDQEHFYWITDTLDGNIKKFKTLSELVETKMYDGKSLRERWSEVTIFSICGVSLDEWLSHFPHSVETDVYEPEDDYALFINGVELDGFIDEDRSCSNCGAYQCYLDDYDEYFCPYCNLWVYDDWWDTEDVHYFKKRPLEPALLWRPQKLLPFCQVRYSIYGDDYSYYCPDQTIIPGEWVVVPVGKENHEKTAQVVSIFQSPANKPPFPLDKIKSIRRKLPSLTEEVSETLSALLEVGEICDLSNEKVPADSSLSYDVLKTPIGHFWLELNHQPIKMSCRVNYPVEETPRFVEASYFLKPYQSDFDDFSSLKICTDVDLRGARLIDSLGGEHQDGNNWQVDNYDIGIAAYPFTNNEDEVALNALGVPYYCEWYKDFQHLYGFTVAWKIYDSDDDLSVWFNI